MVQHYDGPTRGFEASGALGQHLIVKLNGSGQLAVAGATDTDALGTLEREAFAQGDFRAVRCFNHGFSHKMVAAGSVSVGDEVYQAAGGKVSTADGGGSNTKRGVALTAASADGDWVEVASQTD